MIDRKIFVYFVHMNPPFCPQDPPLLFGDFGKVWEFPRSSDSFDKLLVGAWFIYCPASHPFWPTYLLTIIRLKDVSAPPPPLIYLAGSTHELVLCALDPSWIPELRASIASKFCLRPVNFASQLIAESDGEVRKRIFVAMAEIVKGKLNPDTDGMDQWVERFGSNMLK